MLAIIPSSIVKILQEPRRIVLKETRTQRLAGRRRKIVVTKTEMMYIPMLETLQSQLNNHRIFEEVRQVLQIKPFCVTNP